MSNQKKIIIFSGAGMSAESGINTFRDSGGLWENHRIEDVATPQAWEKDPKMVLDFYNQRRSNVLESEPNAAHIAIAKLEREFNVVVITQNIDDLHERSGSKNVLHLHGEIMYARSSSPSNDKLYPIDNGTIQMGEVCDHGHQLRPHVVWFGEMVPNMQSAAQEIQSADYVVIVGTSLNVYPAAGLIDYMNEEAPGYIIDPDDIKLSDKLNIRHIKGKATECIDEVIAEILEKEK